jgi:hypothetical protein
MRCFYKLPRKISNNRQKIGLGMKYKVQICRATSEQQIWLQFRTYIFTGVVKLI